MTKKIGPVLQRNLVRLARAYQKGRPEHSMAYIGQMAGGDHEFFTKLMSPRKGGRPPSFTIRKYDAAVAWLTSKANWPKHIPIPKLDNPVH